MEIFRLAFFAFLVTEAIIASETVEVYRSFADTVTAFCFLLLFLLTRFWPCAYILQARDMKASIETTPPALHALLYYCSFGDYVEILNAPAVMESYVGKICAWTQLSDLVPLDYPRNTVRLTPEQTQEVSVRKLAAGEKITLTIRGE